MKFILQPPGSEKLLEALDAAAQSADCGGGVFAFASKGGIDALFARPNILHMLEQRRPFHLIVGIDAITNVEALLCLSEKVEQFDGALTANVFLHDSPDSTFHPKFSWFVQGNVLKLLTGSGNLTLRGLGKIDASDVPSGNWEAFSIQIFKSKCVTVKKQIDTWLADQRRLGILSELDNGRVLERAMFNGRTRFVKAPIEDKQRTSKPRSKVGVPIDGVEFDTPEILIREIPKNRPGQADVGEAALKEFFGYKEGERKKVLIQYVSQTNELGPVLDIYLFVNNSRNFRLELHAISDMGYDIANDNSRMILIATKLDHRSFRYTILPVTSKSYRKVTTLLGPVPAINNGKRRMREARVTPDNLLAAWKKAPANLLPIKLDTPEF